MQYHHFHFILDAIIIASPDLDSARLKSNQGKATEQNKTISSFIFNSTQSNGTVQNNTKKHILTDGSYEMETVLICTYFSSIIC